MLNLIYFTLLKKRNLRFSKQFFPCFRIAGFQVSILYFYNTKLSLIHYA
jgi:hypothetical protein